MLLNHWFEMHIMRCNHYECSIRSQWLPAFGQRHRDMISESPHLSSIPFGTLVALPVGAAVQMKWYAACEKEVST